MTYAAGPADWDRVAGRLFKAAEAGEPIGLDTEFHGLDVTKESCAGGRARVHVWSVAVFTGKLSPRGHRRAAGVTLPAAALEHPGLITLLEDPDLVKAAHNGIVDWHALNTSGVRVGGMVNTLSLARWVWPGRAADGSGFGLKSLAPAILGIRTMGEYKQVTSRRATEAEREEKVPGLWKDKMTGEWMRQFPLEQIEPGHDLWDGLVVYAGEDAVAALELLDAAQRVAERDFREVPW